MKSLEQLFQNAKLKLLVYAYYLLHTIPRMHQVQLIGVFLQTVTLISKMAAGDVQ